MATADLTIVIAGRDEASKVLKGIQNQAGGLGKTLADVGKIAGGFLAAQAISKGVGALSGFIGDSISQASSLGESINAVNQIFNESSGTILDWGKENATSFGLSQRAFNEMATPMGAVLKNLGFEQDEVADSTINLTKRAADMASVFNTDVEDALAAINSALRGESNPIERYGVSVNQTAVNLRALADTGKDSAESLTEQEKAAARLALIFEQTDAVAGDFASTSDQLANSQRIAAAKTEELQAKIGEKLLPVSLAITRAKLALVGVLADKLLPVMDKVGAVIQRVVVPAFQTVKAGVEAFIYTLKTGFTEDEGTAIERLALVIRDVLPKAFDVARTAIELFSRYYTEILIPAFEMLVNFIQGTFAPNFIAGVQVIYTAVAEAVSFAKPYIEDFVAFLTSRKETIIAVAIAIGAGIALAFPWIALVAAAVAAIGWLSQNWDMLKAKAEEVFTSIRDTVLALLGEETVANITAAFSAIRDIVETVLPYVVEYFTAQFEILKAVVSAAVGFIKDNWGSISAVFAFVADQIIAKLQGLAQAIGGIVGIVSGVVQTVAALIHGDWAAAWVGLKTVAEGAMNLLLGSIKATFGNIPGIILGAASAAASAASAFAQSTVNAILNWFAGLPDKLYQAGVDAVNGFINGLKSVPVLGTAIGIGESIVGGINSFFDNRSPSHVMQAIGHDVIEGFIIGLADKEGSLVSTLQRSVINPVQSAIGVINGLISGFAGGAMSEANQALLAMNVARNPGAGVLVPQTRTSEFGTITAKEAAEFLVGGFGKGLAGVSKTILDTTGMLVGSFEDLQAFIGTSLPGSGSSALISAVSGVQNIMETVFTNFIGQGFTAWQATVSAHLAVLATQMTKPLRLEGFGDVVDEITKFTRTIGSQVETLYNVNVGNASPSTGGAVILTAAELEARGIPSFDSGGVVPGRRGSRQLIMAHGGETVLPTHRGESMGVVINVTGNNFYGSLDSAMENSIKRVVRDAILGGGFRGVLGTA